MRETGLQTERLRIVLLLIYSSNPITWGLAWGQVFKNKTHIELYKAELRNIVTVLMRSLVWVIVRALISNLKSTPK